MIFTTLGANQNATVPDKDDDDACMDRRTASPSLHQLTVAM
jgi:hypothetical protein